MFDRESLQVVVADRLAGALECDPDGNLTFTYEENYAGPDLSVGMPFREEAYMGKFVHAWFLGLLPDNLNVRRGMAAVAGCGPNSVFGLLRVYGMDLPGAVQVLPQGQFDAQAQREATYAPMTSGDVKMRLEALVASERENANGSWMRKGERWSLGGNQAKIALRRFNDEWSACLGAAASNVIVKPGVSWLDSQALDECVSMRLSKMVGLPTADTQLQTFDGFDAIVVDRYDRITMENGFVRRLHQEDVCQALGVVPDKKYAADGGPSSAAVMNLVTGDDTGSGRERFFDALVFNYLIAATDAHAKNYSLLHISRGKYRLAPLYDVASAAPYMKKGQVYRLAMSVGGENRVGWLRRSSLMKFAKMHDLNWEDLADRVDSLAERVNANIEPAVNDFTSCEGIDELASLLIPRMQALCTAAQRNVRVDGRAFKPVDITRIRPK